MSHSHETMLPSGAVPLAIGMVLLALVATTTARIAHLPPSASPVALRAAEDVTPVVSRDLRFSDEPDGSVLIQDAATGQTAGTVPAGSKTGFIRGVMRGLARDREKRGIGAAPPFRLTLWKDGELSLTDSTSGRAIELTAFGATNRAAFDVLLPQGARAMSRRFDTPALVSVEQTDENLFAHVEIDVAVGPGDRVRLHGEPIRLGFGTSARFARVATVERASPLARAWTRLCGHFALTHLYEVSFSPERLS